MRVVIAEDSVLLREGLAGLLARFGFEVAAAVGDAPALLAAVEETTPDLVVTDVRMPPGFTDEGLRAAVALRAAHPGLPVVALSQWVQHSYAGELLGSTRSLSRYPIARPSPDSSTCSAGSRPAPRSSTPRSYGE